MKTIIVVMGVSGSGKSTVGVMLAGALGAEFLEGDDVHPPANVEKMRSGSPLTDVDRWPWLQTIARRVDRWRERGERGVVACSALKRVYRDILVGDRPEVGLVYLRGAPSLIQNRLAARHEHFMPAGLLSSQFSTLQEPAPEEDAIIVDVDRSPADIVVDIVRRIEAR